MPERRYGPQELSSWPGKVQVMLHINGLNSAVIRPLSRPDHSTIQWLKRSVNAICHANLTAIVAAVPHVAASQHVSNFFCNML